MKYYESYNFKYKFTSQIWPNPTYMYDVYKGKVVPVLN
jgi:hypothetical protein